MKKLSDTKIQLSSYAVPYTSYGEIGEQLFKSLFKMTKEVMFRPYSFNEAFGAVNPPHIVNSLITRSLPDYFDYELVTHPHNSFTVLKERAFSNKRRILFTMWESARLDSVYVEQINKNFCAIITTDLWNKNTFIKSGVTIPIHIVPLWVDTNIFSPRQKLIGNENVVFGCAARLSHGGIRKNIPQIIEAFKIAFSGVKDVRLVFKCFPDCYVDGNSFKDERISVIKAYLNNVSIRDWFYGLDAYITAATEGWGWFQQQAVACGVPLVGVNYGPLKQFFNGYECDHTLVNASQEIYNGCGKQVQVDPVTLAVKMREVYDNTADAFVLGHTNTEKATRFNVEFFEKQFEKTLAKIIYGA